MMFILRSRKHARRMVANYDAGFNEASRRVSCLGAESDVELQAVAKMAECAFAIWAGLNPIIAVHWGESVDSGYDVLFFYRVDVKETAMENRFLIWPLGKNDIWRHKRERFDVLVLVKSAPPLFLMAGWVDAETFESKHCVADDEHPLRSGTWFMHERNLRSMDHFPF